MIKYGFETLGFEVIVACADKPNTASIRVMEKAGMQFDRQEIIDGMDTVFYKIRSESYRPFDMDFRVDMREIGPEKNLFDGESETMKRKRSW
jgi:hypothetical protein